MENQCQEIDRVYMYKVGQKNDTRHTPEEFVTRFHTCAMLFILFYFLFIRNDFSRPARPAVDHGWGETEREILKTYQK